MSKPSASYYCRYGDLIVSATLGTEAFGPDMLDELRTQVMRGFSEAMNHVDAEEPDATVVVDTTQLPPLD